MYLILSAETKHEVEKGRKLVVEEEQWIPSKMRQVCQGSKHLWRSNVSEGQRDAIWFIIPRELPDATVIGRNRIPLSHHGIARLNKDDVPVKAKTSGNQWVVVSCICEPNSARVGGHVEEALTLTIDIGSKVSSGSERIDYF
jgi:hypothetical protein